KDLSSSPARPPWLDRRRHDPFRSEEFNTMKWLSAGFLWVGMSVLAGPAAAQALNLSDAGGGALSPPASHDHYLYVGSGTTIGVWDMADPSHPTWVGRTSATPTAGPIDSLVTVGGYLYA